MDGLHARGYSRACYLRRHCGIEGLGGFARGLFGGEHRARAWDGLYIPRRLTVRAKYSNIPMLTERQTVDDAPLQGHNLRADDESREAVTSRTLPGDSSSAFLFRGYYEI